MNYLNCKKNNVLQHQVLSSITTIKTMRILSLLLFRNIKIRTLINKGVKATLKAL